MRVKLSTATVKGTSGAHAACAMPTGRKISSVARCCERVAVAVAFANCMASGKIPGLKSETWATHRWLFKQSDHLAVGAGQLLTRTVPYSPQVNGLRAWLGSAA
jgi:hypothetical protein